MANSITKTYAIELKYSYEPASEIAEDDLHVAELRAQIKEWIDTKVGSVSKGNLVVHKTGDCTES